VISWLRVVGIVFVFCIASVGWLALGVVMEGRTRSHSRDLHGSVEDLWGRAQEQRAPELRLVWQEEVEDTRVALDRSKARDKSAAEQPEEPPTRLVQREQPVTPASSDIRVDLDLDHRRKGLIWYPLYGVAMDGRWSWTHVDDFPASLCASLRFPDPGGLYDDFRFQLGGRDASGALRHGEGVVEDCVEVAPGATVDLAAGYSSRGMSSWSYRVGDEVTTLEDFSMEVTTDFEKIDFPAMTMSPSSKERRDAGWVLEWDFDRVVTGRGIGVLMPDRLQPGTLATRLAFAAPISLGFFFLVIFVLATLRGLDIHPVNYLFLAGAFFAFHLLFGYSVDVLPVVPAFVLCSVVSVFLVVSYLRLVVSARFALLEAAGAQLVYLVGFSLAYFVEGLTGLTLTVVSILTLYLLMKMTAKLNWTVVLGRKADPEALAPEGALSRVKGLSRTKVLGVRAEGDEAVPAVRPPPPESPAAPPP